MKQQMIEAIKAKLLGEIKSAEANLAIYLQNPVGVGEHGDVVESARNELKKIADAKGELEALKDIS